MYTVRGAGAPGHAGARGRAGGTAVVTPGIGVAFIAGVFSFLSPCVLPLVPTYLAYVGGSAEAKRVVLVRNALAFIAGFSLVFIALGAGASALGSVLRSNQRVLMLVGGALVILFGLVMLGVIKLPWLYRDTRVQYSGETKSPFGALVLGMAFAAGWTPCIGPILGAILTMASATGTLASGVGLLAVYALGLGVPFLLAALLLDPFMRFSKGFRRYLPWVERGAGVILLIAGVLMITGTYTALNAMLINVTPTWLLDRL
ncbi:MAG TPA: cytochrome c biogenesis protein CcdA [Trueperaceae bacterium]|nr:cytochrome c biogenesis protein CcdA [Trueperaceae bacterium]